jgi:hypothetical protein
MTFKKVLFFLIILLATSGLQAALIDFPAQEVERILSKSPEEIIQTARDRSIEIYKFKDPIPTESKDVATPFLNQLENIDQSRFVYFNDLFDGSTLGVYFSKHTNGTDLTSDTILFSDQADRWTIAHEFAHAFIDKKRPSLQKRNEAEDIEKLRNAKEDYEEILSLYRNNGHFPSWDYEKRALESLSIWTELLLNSLYTYEIEEVRIETFMQKLYREKPHYQLDDHTYKRSFWYINKNCTSALNKLNHSVEVFNYLKGIVEKSFLDQNEENFKKIDEQLKAHAGVIGQFCKKRLE